MILVENKIINYAQYTITQERTTHDIVKCYTYLDSQVEYLEHNNNNMKIILL